MLGINLFSVFVAILGLMPEKSQETNPFLFARHLGLCPGNEETVFTTDGSNCYTFRNPCHVRRDDYERRRANIAKLSLTTKLDCQTKCPQECSNSLGFSVCGEYAGIYTLFKNDCELWKTACLNGQGIVKVHISDCMRKC